VLDDAVDFGFGELRKLNIMLQNVEGKVRKSAIALIGWVGSAQTGDWQVLCLEDGRSVRWIVEAS